MSKGFTLVELIVTLGIFGVIMVAGSSFLIQMIRSANQAAVQNEVRQNASSILQDIVAQARQADCVYYASPAPPPATAMLRISDDPNGVNCDNGNRVEYYQDQNGVVTRAATDSGGVAVGFGVLTSANSSILDCRSSGLVCGWTSAANCAAGLVVTSGSNPPSETLLLVGGASATVTIYSQQIPGQTKTDYCANVKLSDTVTPRIK